MKSSSRTVIDVLGVKKFRNILGSRAKKVVGQIFTWDFYESSEGLFKSLELFIENCTAQRKFSEDF